MRRSERKPLTASLSALALVALLAACQGVAEPESDALESGFEQCQTTTGRPYGLLDAQGLRQAAPHASAVPVPGELLVAYRAPDSAQLRAARALLQADGSTAAVATVGEAQVFDAALELQASAVRSQHGLKTLAAAGGAGLPELVSAADELSVLAGLRADPRVLYAHQNYYLATQFLPDDALFQQQWNVRSFGLPEAWNTYLKAPERGEVVLAVIDTGVDPQHPDLAAKLLTGWDFNGKDADTTPGPAGAAAHGTHVAGIAAARSSDDGIIGVAFVPEVRILPVKVFDDGGAGGTVADLVQAIRWAAGLSVSGAPRNENPAHVINLSVGVAGTYPGLDAAVRAAWQAGSLVVAAAGNHAGGAPAGGVLSPANAPCAIAVGSVDSDRRLSSFSNTGPEVELVAPGGSGLVAFGGSGGAGCNGVISTLPGGRYGCMSGTSMATPFVAGIAALVISQLDAPTPEAVRRLLTESTSRVDHYPTGTAGHGLLCADTALGASTNCGELVIAPDN